jgi:thiol:disulfide interchange protein DsbA
MLKKYINYIFIWVFIVNTVSIIYAEPTNTVQIPINKLSNSPVQTNNVQIQAGIHYKKLADKIRTNVQVQQLTNQAAGKVQVIMFFSYGCGVCRRLNEPFDTWAKQQNKDKVEISKVPVSFNNGWTMLAQAFYTIQILNKSAVMDEIIFAGIHDEAKPLWQEDKMEEFLFERGISRELFKQTFHSFNVSNKVKWANDLSLAFELPNIPNIIIHGPYGSYITNLVTTKDLQFLFTVIDHLIQKELKNK